MEKHPGGEEPVISLNQLPKLCEIPEALNIHHNRFSAIFDISNAILCLSVKPYLSKED